MLGEKNPDIQKDTTAIKVLIADDDPPTRMLLRAGISQWGYEVIEASDGEEAWNILQGPDAPRLLILDWLMPKLDGVELCARIKKELKYQPYIILLTQVNGTSNIVKSLESGVDEFISKPFNMAELRSRISVGARLISTERVIAKQNKQLQEYMLQMENLAEERARELIHHTDLLIMLGALIHGVSHEIYSTININNHDIERIKELNHNLEQIIDVTRSLQIDSEMKNNKPSSFQINDVIEKSISICQNAFKNKKIIFNPANKLPTITTFLDSIQQALIGILLNAADILKKETDGTLQIYTSLFQNNVIRIVIETSGPQIQDDELINILQPYLTLNKTKKHKFKLSIAMSKDLLLRQNGVLNIESRSEGGLRFIVDLPLNQAG